MSVFPADCPRCGVKRVAFTVKGEWRYEEYPPRWDTLAVCGHCRRGIVATFEVVLASDSPMETRTLSSESYRLLAIAPKPPGTRAPPHTPDTVAEFFRQGADNLPRNPDAAGAMFRKALEVGLKDKYPALEGSLKKRIDKAAADDYLTRDLADWANQIRLDGNEAVHGEAPLSREDASRLHEFTKLVFWYLFTLPGRLEKARGTAAGQG